MKTKHMTVMRNDWNEAGEHRCCQLLRWRITKHAAGDFLGMNAMVIVTDDEKLSCGRETARRFVSLNISLSHSESLN